MLLFSVLMVDRSGSDAAFFSFDGGQGICAVRTFRKDTGLIFPEGTMKPTAPAFRADALIAAVIVVGAGCLLHEQIKGLQISGCHVAHFQKLLSSPLCRHLQVADITSFWATKKEGLLLTPKWRKKQTLFVYDCLIQKISRMV